jgi:hypothetical protein
MAAPKLHQQRCYNHAGREAAACCPECHRYFCRECVSEHDDRLLCAACLIKTTKPPLSQRSGFQIAAWGGKCCLGVLAVWLFFHWSALILMKIPTDYHQGTAWKTPWLEQ